MFRMARRLSVVVTTTGLLALGASTASASASTPTSISDLPTSAPLVEKLYVPVTFTVTCSPSEVPWSPPPLASVTIRQAVAAHQIAHGTATIPSLTCDDTGHSYTVNVFPGDGGFVTSPPFKKGDALISAQVGGFFGPASATAGPQTIRLK